MPDYNNGKIYKLWSPEGIEIYIGSTTTSLSQRKAKHKHNSHLCRSKILFEKYDDVRIELIENCPCNSKEELDKQEGEHIRKNTECVNMRIAGRTPKEWYQDNREHNKERCKEYYENNKEKFKEYYEKNSEKINEKNSQPYLCECGRTITFGKKTRHLTSKIHQLRFQQLD